MTVTTRGRPREFEIDVALDRAIDVFWRQGYDSTSLTDLTTAMDIARPSLYAAFGGKRSLFERAFTRYLAIDMGYVVRALAETQLKDVFSRYLLGTAAAVTRNDRPHGCMSVQLGGVHESEDVGTESQEVRAFVSRARDAGLARLTERIAQGITEEAYELGDLKARDVAQYLTSVSSGMALRAADGASHDELETVARIAIRSLR